MHLWGDGGVPRDAILEALAREGIAPRPLDLDHPQGPAVVVFTSASTGLFELIRDASCRGLERVPAVAWTSAALDAEACWRALDAGASVTACIASRR